MVSKKGLECEISLAINNDLLETCKKLVQEKKQLKVENERLKELKCEFKEYCTCNIEKYIHTLQEIKAIAETGMHCEGMGCDFMPQILDLITKAESEG